MVDVEELRRLKEDADHRIEEQFRRAQIPKGERILPLGKLCGRVRTALIPRTLKNAANQGRTSAAVMVLRPRHIHRSLGGQSGYGRTSPEWLKGSAKVVFDYCLREHLNPSVIWVDGDLLGRPPSAAHDYYILVEW